MSTYNFASLWESNLREAQSTLYKWSHKIALRGIKQEISQFPFETTVELKIDEILRELASYSKIQVSQATIEQIKQPLIDVYSQPHRHYHNLEHVFKVAELCIIGKLAKKERLLLSLAAWFHDIVYNPIRSDNKEKSALLMEKILAPFKLEKHLISRVKTLILATKDHLNTPGRLAQYLVDADLSIFAEPQEAYNHYTMAVRSEYAHVSDEIFYPARLVFLEKLSKHIEDKGRLYHHFHPLHEQIAKENIQREIANIHKRIE